MWRPGDPTKHPAKVAFWGYSARIEWSEFPFSTSYLPGRWRFRNQNEDKFVIRGKSSWKSALQLVVGEEPCLRYEIGTGS